MAEFIEGCLLLDSGDYHFKIADQDWGGSGGLNLGANADVVLDTIVTLTPGSNANIHMLMPLSIDLVFELNASDVSNPTLLVSELVE